MTASSIKFRCSSLGYLMTEPRSKSETLSETAKTHCIDVFVSNKYNRFTETYNKFFEKGDAVEEDSITVVSRLTKTFLKKNQETLSNEYIQGTPDLFIGKSIMEAERIRDTKSSWDIYTFNRAISKPLESNYWWQGQGYMALTGAGICNVDYCLNNTPYHILEGELRKESYRHEGSDTPAWIELQIIANHVYDLQTFYRYIQIRGIVANDDNSKAVIEGFTEVPLEERHFSFEFKRDDEAIDRLYKRVEACREWMNINLFKQQLQEA